MGTRRLLAGGLMFVAWSACAVAADTQSSILLSRDINSQTELRGWLWYAGARLQWIEKNYPAKNRIRTPYRHSFEEEVYGRSATAEFWKILRKDKPGDSIPYFDDLTRVEDAHFMREYVWIYLRDPAWPRPAKLKSASFDAWRARNLPGHKAVTRAEVVPPH